PGLDPGSTAACQHGLRVRPAMTSAASALQRRVLDDRLVRIARAEILVGADHALDRDDIADLRFFGARDDQVVGVGGGGAGAVAQVDPVLAHDPPVVLDDLPADQDRLVLHGGGLGQHVRYGVGVGAARLGHLDVGRIGRLAGARVRGGYFLVGLRGGA